MINRDQISKMELNSRLNRLLLSYILVFIPLFLDEPSSFDERAFCVIAALACAWGIETIYVRYFNKLLEEDKFIQPSKSPLYLHWASIAFTITAYLIYFL